MSTTLQRAQIETAIFDVLRRIAPEVDLADIDPELELRDQIDIDSMDFLNLVIGVHRDLGVDIPEADYPKLVTLGGFVDYVQNRLAAV